MYWKLLILVVLICGCEKPQGVNYEPKPVDVRVTDLTTNDGYGSWRLVEFTHNGMKYTYIQHYDRDNQSMLLIETKPYD